MRVPSMTLKKSKRDSERLRKADQRIDNKNQELREKAEMLRSAREIVPQTKLHHISSDPDWQRAIADELAEWADKEDSRLLDSFPLSKRIAPMWFYRMANDNEYFARALQYAKAKLGERMEERIQDSPIYISKALPMYSTLWMEAEERKLKEESKYVYEIKEVKVAIPVIGEPKNEE